jgi:poly[(R)-3-hydroxyalkanoate] polymerase subunit PhaC
MRPDLDGTDPAMHLPQATPESDLKRQILAQLAAVTGGLAPADYFNAWWEWYRNLATHPDRQLALARSAAEKLLDDLQFAAQAAWGAPLQPQGEHMGFASSAWKLWPFNVMARGYINWVSWWQEALGQATSGADPNLTRVRVATRLLLEAASPANFLYTNPELLKQTAEESGQNLVRGLKYWLEDVRQAVEGRRHVEEPSFQVGRQVATTAGKVVFRNRLIELLQYAPQTPTVYAEPVLITPAWIMKYYILDLSPRNSLVRYLVEKGHTVFVISWKNPTAADRELRLEDYVQLGFLDALTEVNRIVPDRKVHAIGYCIGGTLLSIAAALLAGRGNFNLATLSLLAVLVDFSEPGELSAFISPSQVALLEALMQQKGVLESERMTAAFTLLRSQDLLWTPAVETYVRGERPKITDLMAWNADGTRMPWRMHSEYLERLYLKNELASGKLIMAGGRIDLSALRAPMFVVGTETDHVTPWRSVYKVRRWTRSSDFTFVLTSGGHNAGIVSGPEHPRRRYRLLTWTNESEISPPDDWLTTTPVHTGSWWPAWQQWLAQHSDAQQQPAREVTGVEDAPGRYVHE